VASIHATFLSSYFAVKVNPVSKQETALTADADGMISPKAGDVLRFKHEKTNAYVPLGELLVHAGAQNVRLQINDSKKHIWRISAGETMGISGMAIYSITVLDACTFSYEGLAD